MNIGFRLFKFAFYAIMFIIAFTYIKGMFASVGVDLSMSSVGAIFRQLNDTFRMLNSLTDQLNQAMDQLSSLN